jgi:hypothetical protein
MISHISRICALGALTALAGGCSTTHSAPTYANAGAASAAFQANRNPALVMPSPELQLAAVEAGYVPGAWEDSRNDDGLGEVGSRFFTEVGVGEIRHYEFLRNEGGRPRNDSWTYSRSYQRVSQ